MRVLFLACRWLHFLCVYDVASGSRALSWDGERSTSSTHAWESVVWQDLLWWKAVPVSHLHPSCYGKSPTVSSARPEQKLVSVQSFCVILKLSSVQAFSPSSELSLCSQLQSIAVLQYPGSSLEPAFEVCGAIGHMTARATWFWGKNT